MRVFVIAVVLAAGCARSPLTPTPPSPRPPQPAPMVDVLDYIVGDPSLWPRYGDQQQHQVAIYDHVCWVKYGRSEMFECWRWDEQWVYHVIDRALDGETGEAYQFSDGRWLPRHLPTDGPWFLDVPNNRVRWWSAECRPMPAREGIPDDTGIHLFPYQLRAWIERDVVIGGDLGVRDVLVLEYASYPPGGSPGPPETFRFAKGAGWYEWSSPRGRRSFTQVGGPRRRVALPCLDGLDDHAVRQQEW